VSRIKQILDTLEAERADLGKRLAWIEKQIKEFSARHRGDAAEPTTPAPRRRASSRAATSAPATTTRRPRARTASRAGNGDVRSQIVAHLQQHPNSTASEIASATGLKRSTVSTRLTQMAKAGEIKKQARGYAAK
jgi:predicted Rossmann fold nucleotide-binding protein DprA/Smf involved in DNA uptake